MADATSPAAGTCARAAADVAELALPSGACGSVTHSGLIENLVGLFNPTLSEFLTWSADEAEGMTNLLDLAAHEYQQAGQRAVDRYRDVIDLNSNVG